MKKHIFPLLLLAATSVFTACGSMQSFTFDQLYPADITYPDQVKNVAVVNNMAEIPTPKDDLLTIGLLEGDGKVAAETLAEALADSRYFNQVIICDSALRAMLFPGVVSPVLIGRTSSLNLVNYLKETPTRHSLCSARRTPRRALPARKEELYDYGVYAKIIRALEMPGQTNNVTVILQGLGRCKLTELKSISPFLRGVVEVASEENTQEEGQGVHDWPSRTSRRSTIDYIKKNDEIPWTRHS